MIINNNFIIIFLLLFFSSTVGLYSQENINTSNIEENKEAVVIPEVVDEVPTEDPIYRWSMGCLLPLTGKYSVLGDKALRGLRVAVESMDIGNLYKIYIKDTESTAEGVKRGLASIYSDINPTFILGPMPSLHAQQVKGVLNSKQTTTLIFPVFKNSSVNGSKFINFYLPIETQIKNLAEFTSNDLNLKKFAVLYPDNEYGRAFYTNFSRTISKKGGQIVYKGSYKNNLENIDTEIEWLKAYDIEAILIPDGASKSSVIIKKIISDSGINNIIFLGTSNWNSSVFLNLVGDDLDGVLYKAIFTDYFYHKDEDWIEFEKTYREIFQQKPGSLEFQIYKSVRLLMRYSGNNIYNSLQNLKDPHYSVRKRASGIDIYPEPMIFSITNNDINKID